MDPALLEIRRRLLEDFEFYAPRALNIRTKDGQIAPFKLNRAQLMLMEAVEAQKASLGRIRVIILKARQMGLSTVVGGRMFWKTSQNKGRRAIVVTHAADSTRALFDMTRRYYEKCPAILKPTSKYSSRRELAFGTLDSSYIVATAGGDGIARGETITEAHLSELAFWPPSSAAENFSGLMQSIPNEVGTEVYIESTANGVSGLFYDQWQKAVRGESDFIAVFLPWFIDPGYRLPVAPNFARTPDEDDLVGLVSSVYREDLDDQQLTFRRKKIAEIGLDKFKQEYPTTADEAFLTSGRPVFNPDQIVGLLENVRPPLAKMALEGTEWLKHPRGELSCFLPHDPAETYYIGCDVGMGVQRDWSVAQVFDSKKRQAAVFRAQVDPDYYATVLYHLGNFYNEAKIIVESNNHGILTNVRLGKDMAYPNFFTEVVFDKITEKETVKLGFTTTVKSKPLIIDKLRAAMRDNELEIYDRVTLEEMRSYIVTEEGKMEAESGLHDDCVMSLALANHIHEGAYIPIQNRDEWFVKGDY